MLPKKNGCVYPFGSVKRLGHTGRRVTASKQAQAGRKKEIERQHILKAQREVEIANRRLQELGVAPRNVSEDDKCPICYERERTMAAVPCGHRICEICSREPGARKNCCICRQHLESYMKIF